MNVIDTGELPSFHALYFSSLPNVNFISSTNTSSIAFVPTFLRIGPTINSMFRQKRPLTVFTLGRSIKDKSQAKFVGPIPEAIAPSVNLMFS